MFHLERKTSMAKTKKKVEERLGPERRQPVYKYRELIAAIGSDADVQNAFRNGNYYVPPASTIRGWRTRNSIPSVWVPLLIAHAMETGRLHRVSSLISAAEVVRHKKKGKDPVIPHQSVIDP
jgi:hypothetical protein